MESEQRTAERRRSGQKGRIEFIRETIGRVGSVRGRIFSRGIFMRTQLNYAVEMVYVARDVRTRPHEKK